MGKANQKELLNMKYRDHKGSLAESMETVQNFKKIEDLEEHLTGLYSELFGKVENVLILYNGYDERTDWQTYNIQVKFEKNENYKVVGYSNSMWGMHSYGGVVKPLVTNKK